MEFLVFFFYWELNWLLIFLFLFVGGILFPGFHLSGTVTAPKTSGGSPLPPASSSGGGGAAGGGVVVPGGTAGGAVAGGGGGGTGGPPVETEKKYRVSVSFDR